MALQINNFTGFETQGFEETPSVVGSPTFDTTDPRSGSSALNIGGATAQVDLAWVADGITDAGTDYIFGIAIRKTGNPSTEMAFLAIRDDSGAAAIMSLALQTDGTVQLEDAANGTLDTSAALNNDQWYYFEVYAELNSASGAWEWFQDGISIGNNTGADLTDGNAFGSATSVMRIAATPVITTLLVDDLYILSGATAATDRLGGGTISEMPEVFMYQNDLASATADLSAVSGGGAVLNSGNWDDAAETPGNETNSADFTGTPLDGVAYTDGGSRAGPSGDSNIDGDSNIKAWKGIWHAERGGGGATTHTIYIGNDADTEGNFDNTTIALLNNTEADFEFLGETDPPLSTENFAQGFGLVGNQDFRCREMWATLLHVPSVAAGGGRLLLINPPSLDGGFEFGGLQ